MNSYYSGEILDGKKEGFGTEIWESGEKSSTLDFSRII